METELFKGIKNKKHQGKPCISDISCKTINPASIFTGVAAEGGEYNEKSGIISVYSCYTCMDTNASLQNYSLEQLKSIILHEFSHAESICRQSPGQSCESCMIEEKRAYWRSGQCINNKDCTAKAASSCASGIFAQACQGKKTEDFYGVGDITDIPKLPGF
jgi:hypothetical protein